LLQSSNLFKFDDQTSEMFKSKAPVFYTKYTACS